jgi:hypothetical protein
VSAGSAIWWLKISKAGTRYEGPLLRVLAQTGHRLIPDVIVHSRHPWLLIADAPGFGSWTAGLAPPI